MNSETAYQNRDQNNLNPLAPETGSDTPAPPLNPKIRLLIIITLIILGLLVVNLLVTSVNKSKSRIIPQPKPSPTLTPSPNGSDNGNSDIPSDYKTKFDLIDSNNQTEINFNPPQITDDIGR